VSVRYAVVFSGYAEPGEPTEGVESGEGGASGAELHPTAPQLQDIVAKALRQETSLPLDIQTLTFEAGKHPVHSLLL